MPAKKTTNQASKKSAKKAAVKTAVVHGLGAGGSLTAVRVRMYRQGLGDCFLITFDPDRDPVHALVDCGSLGAKTTGVKLAKVVADIREVTKDHLHLVIATHEHEDHVCGFRDRMEDFEGITVDNVWMAWTEDPDDDLAQEIQVHKKDLGLTLALVAGKLATSGGQESTDANLAIQSLLGFSGDIRLGAKFATTVDEAMTFVRTGLGVEARYLKPGGKAIELPGLNGFRFYVLGPPRSLSKLQNMGSHESEELYHLSGGLRAAAAGGASEENEMPFDRRFRCKESEPTIKKFLAPYFEEEASWRKVDKDWLDSATDLALQLDKLTNNTSLVLAIERISDGKVMLFPADAQEGNWLSWHDEEMTFTYTEGETTHKKTAAELLKSTVFYKVGHHGSHNATASKKGLDLMSSTDELVAFVPVDRAVALGRNPKDSWQMPAFALYRTLLEKCQGRVVRSDTGWAAEASTAGLPDVEKEFLEMASPTAWTKWGRSQRKATQAGTVEVGDLFIDFNLR